MNLEATLSQLIADLQSQNWLAVGRDAPLMLSEIFALFLTQPATVKAAARTAHAAQGPIAEADIVPKLQRHLADAKATGSFDWSKLIPILMQVLQLVAAQG